MRLPKPSIILAGKAYPPSLILSEWANTEAPQTLSASPPPHGSSPLDSEVMHACRQRLRAPPFIIPPE